MATTTATVLEARVKVNESGRVSLGDRACLALGIATQSPVYTADRAWTQLKAGVAIHLVR